MYRKYGYRQVYYALIGKHQSKCQYTPQACPAPKPNFGICAWTGITRGMKTHLKEAHIYVCVDKSGRGSLAVSGVTAAAKCCKVVPTLNNVFHFRCEVGLLGPA